MAPRAAVFGASVAIAQVPSAAALYVASATSESMTPVPTKRRSTSTSSATTISEIETLRTASRRHPRPGRRPVRRAVRPDCEPERDGSKGLDDLLEERELIGLENDDLAGVGRIRSTSCPLPSELGANLGEERPDVENDLVPLQRDELALVVDQPVHGLHGRPVRGRPHVHHPRASQDSVDRLDRDSVEAGGDRAREPGSRGRSAPCCCATASLE